MTSELLEKYRQVRARLTRPGERFELATTTVAGVPMRVYANSFPELTAFYENAETRAGTAALISEGEQSLTYSETFLASRRLGASLQDRFGVGPGDRVGLICRNRPEWLIAFFAITMVGGVAVLFNGRASATELSLVADGMGCKAIVADGKRIALVAEAGLGWPVIAIPEDGWGETSEFKFEALIAVVGREAEYQRLTPDSPAAMLFTSGTTGVPKAALISHRNLCSLTINLEFLSAVGLTLAADRMGVPLDVLRSMVPRSVSLLIFPLFHVSGLTALFMTMLTGGQLVTMRRWKPEEAIGWIERHQVTILTGPALIISDLLDLPEAAEKLSRIVNVGVGGQATPVNLALRMQETLPNAQQGNGWGMTELTGSVSAANGMIFAAKPDSCGFLSPVMDVRTVDANGNVLPAGALGEFELRGPHVMLGYWNAKAETAAVLRDGWLATGDMGYIDEDDFIYLVDRKKDMVICAGENIFCGEVEKVISSDPRVEEVALFGVPDDRLGERTVAAVNFRLAQSANADELARLVANHLADYKVPREFVLGLGPFPRNGIGKVDKRRLRTAYLELQHSL